MWKPTFQRITAFPACNFACLYCNPQRLYEMNMMPTRELLDVIDIGIKLGIPDVHFTGGEALLRPDFVELVAETHRLGAGKIEVTTNGMLYQRMADRLALAGLTGLNISIDSFDPEIFKYFTGIDGLQRVLASIEKARELHPNNFTVNVVVQTDNLGEIPKFIEFSERTGVIVRFCELTPHGPYMLRGPGYFNHNHVTKEEILAAISKCGVVTGFEGEVFDNQNAHSEYGKIQTRYGELTFGIIAPYSNGWPCSKENCRRLRIGPTGADTCVALTDVNLIGIPYDEKVQAIMRIIDERNRQIELDQHPERHEPTYGRRRFGIS